MYAGINVLTELMYFQQILYLLGVNKYYGYGMVIWIVRGVCEECVRGV